MFDSQILTKFVLVFGFMFAMVFSVSPSHASNSRVDVFEAAAGQVKGNSDKKDLQDNSGSDDNREE